jgi:hypothetical protein
MTSKELFYIGIALIGALIVYDKLIKPMLFKTTAEGTATA